MRACAALAALALGACAPAADAPPGPRTDGLLRQMRSCVADPGQGPVCAAVAPERGFVVIKDDAPEKPYAWLLVPTSDVTGIEDQAVLRAPVAGFWAIGWAEGRRLVPAPPESLGLAINSVAGRSQNLLHIHLSCLDPAVRAALDAAAIGPAWTARPDLPLAGRVWTMRRVADFAPESPFVLLRDLAGPEAEMGEWSLAAVAAAGGGYVLLADRTRPGAPAEAEELLDETCGR
jgi:CDP-diacylglycerol pyrophosphatase